MFILVFVSYDSELGRTWLTGGVDRQSRTGLIFVNVIIIVIINVIIIIIVVLLWHRYLCCRTGGSDWRTDELVTTSSMLASHLNTWHCHRTVILSAARHVPVCHVDHLRPPSKPTSTTSTTCHCFIVLTWVDFIVFLWLLMIEISSWMHKWQWNIKYSS